MDHIVDSVSSGIARHLRIEREGRNWSLADLAARSGVAKATISKIEREEMSPTAVLLVRLAGAFDLTLAGLLLRAEGGSDELLSRASDQPLWRDPATGYLRRQIFMRSDHPLEAVQVELPAREKVTLPASSYARIRQLVLVQAGTLAITEGGTQHLLQAGDCLGFGPPSEVTIANESSSPCTYLVLLVRS